MRVFKNAVLSYVLLAYSSMPFISNAFVFRSIIGIFALSAPRIAYAVDPEGAQGQAFGEALLTQPSSVTYNAATNSYSTSGSTTMDIDPSTGQVTADGTQTGNSMFPDGGDADLDAVTKAGPTPSNPNPTTPPTASDLSSLRTGPTERGAAYNTVLNGHVQRKALPPMSSLKNDPILDSSRDTLTTATHPDAAAVFNGSCTTTTTQTVTTGEAHVPKTKSCQITSVVAPICSVSRIISASQYTQTVLDAPTVRVDGTTVIRFRVIENGALSKAYVSDLNQSHNNYWLQNQIASDWSSRGGLYTVNESNDAGAPWWLPATETLSPIDSANISGWGTSYIIASIALNVKPGNQVPIINVSETPSKENGWVVEVTLQDPDNQPHDAMFEVMATIVSATQTINDVPVGCVQSIDPADFPSSNYPAFVPNGSPGDDASTYLFKCSDAFYSRQFGTATITSADFGAILGPLFKGAPSPPAPICMAADLRTPASTNATAQCYTDIHGNNVCNTGDAYQSNDTCAPLANDPACVFQKSTCVSTNQDGSCQVTQRQYDCGVKQQVVSGSTKSTGISCVGVVKCMGTECVTPSNEQNKDFGKAASALAVAQMGALDTDCGTGTICPLFTGKPGTCKTAFGGVADCCAEPAGISPGEYLTGAFNMYALAQKSGAIDAAGTAVQNQIWSINVPGSFMESASGVQQSFNAMTKPFTTAWESTTKAFSSVDGVVSEAVSSVSSAFTTTVTTIQQQLTNVSAEFLNTVLGPNTLVTETADAAGNYAVDELGNQAMEAIGNIVSGVGTAIMVAQLTMLAIQMAYKCEKDEMELTANKAMGLCHSVGPYCKQMKMGACIEVRESFCCYKTQLGKIIQEQVRLPAQTALGKNWGDASSPDCSGLTPDDLGKVDWDAVDFSDWVAIATQSGLLSDGTETDMAERFNMENVTQTHAMTYAQTKISGKPTPKSGDAEQIINGLDPTGNTDTTRTKTGDALLQAFP